MVRLGLPKTPPSKAALTTSFVNPVIGGELGQTPLSRFIHRDVSRTALEHIMSVISIQSQVVYGHVGNSAAVFPMQMPGIEVMAVPTTLFSNRPRYPTVRGQVLDAGLVADLLVGLEERGAVDTCQVILTGYLGSPQIGEVVADFVGRAMKQNPKLIYCCDPVIGDAERGVFVARRGGRRSRRSLMMYKKSLLDATTIIQMFQTGVYLELRGWSRRIARSLERASAVLLVRFGRLTLRNLQRNNLTIGDEQNG